MRLLVQGDTRLRVEGRSPGLHVESTTADAEFTSIHMLAASVATCILDALLTWADRAGLDSRNLAVQIRWDFLETPHRVGRYDVTVEWPQLEDRRHAAALRAAGFCTVKNTLANPPTLEVRLNG